MKYSMDTQLGTLLDLPQAKTIIDKYMPGVSTHPMISMARGLTLNMILSTPQAAQLGLDKAKVEKILEEINKVVK